MLARHIAGSLILLFPAAALLAEAGDVGRGERTFQRCYSCHSVDPNETAKLQGPSLYRIMGRPAAAILSFEYSDAMRARGAAGLVLDATTLEDYIANPEGVVAGTSMSAPPLRDAHERADLIAYLALSGRYRP
jgi:cytochrome c2